MSALSPFSTPHVPAVILIQCSETAGPEYLGYFRTYLPKIKSDIAVVHYKALNAKHLGLLPKSAAASEWLTRPHYCIPTTDVGLHGNVMEPCEAHSENPQKRTYQVVGVMAFGGPMSAYDHVQHPFLQNIIQLLKSAVAEQVPVLGICLGAQLLAIALGGDCVKHTTAEFAFVPLTVDEEAAYTTPEAANASKARGIFNWFGGRAELNSFQAHMDTIVIPESCIRLATGKHCASQAFQLPHQYVMGVQWHPDVDDQKAATWVGLCRKYFSSSSPTDRAPPGHLTWAELDEGLAKGEWMTETHQLADSIFNEWFTGVYSGKEVASTSEECGLSA